jgi:hypothetical protein
MYLANLSRYLFSPGIDRHISLTHATLDLAISCTTFFSKRHYDVDVLGDDDGFTGLLLDGSYRLLYFAVDGWYELVKKYLQLTQNKPLPLELVHCLRTLMVKSVSCHVLMISIGFVSLRQYGRRTWVIFNGADDHAGLPGGVEATGCGPIL